MRNNSCVVWNAQRGIPEEAEKRKAASTKKGATKTSDEAIEGQSKPNRKRAEGHARSTKN
jgi:hypothetical protein